MLKNKHKNDLPNDWKWECFRVQRNITVLMRKKAIKSYIMSRCKPGATSKDVFDTVAPFLCFLMFLK